jgi:hypothetical protein
MGFYERNEEAMATEQAAVEKQASEWGNNADMCYLLAGSTLLRLLPAYSERGMFFRKIIRHRTRTASGTVIVACPASQDLPCGLCEKAQELKDTGDPIKMKFAKDNLKPQVKYLYNVVVYAAPADGQGKSKEFGKVYVMEGGIMVHRQIISLDTDAMLGWADITNLNTGVNISIKRTGSNLDTKYEVLPTSAGRTDLIADLQARGFDPNQLGEQVVNLDELYPAPPEEKIAEILAGLQVGSTPSVQPGAAFPALQPVPVQAAPQVPAPAAPANPASPAIPVAPAPTGGPAQPDPGVVQQPTAQALVQPTPTASAAQPVQTGTPTPVAAVAAPVIPEPPKAE